MKLALVGFMGAGKTTVGREVARRLDLPFVDLDQAVESKFGRIEDQFARDGEAVFRTREQQALAALPQTPHVVALGGGTFCQPQTAAKLANHLVVALCIGLEEAKQRISGSSRPLASKVDELYHRRAVFDAEAAYQLDASRPVDQVVDALCALVQDHPIDVGASTSYQVHLQRGFGLLHRLAPKRLIVLTDDNVGPLHLPRLLRSLPNRQVATIVVQAGEGSKSLTTYGEVMDQCLAFGVDRETGVLTLGGGVVGDLGGFVASTLLRGVPLYALPTSVLAMVDSSVGGKTAINHSSGKNLIGSFFQPRAVIADLSTLATLDPHQWRCGLVEALKVALLQDRELAEQMLEEPAAFVSLTEAFEEMLRRAIAAKARIVEEDEHERGRRVVLNAGHTIGHGLERLCDLPHGEAVGLGLLIETEWAVQNGHCKQADLPERIGRCLHSWGLKTSAPPLDVGALIALLKADKKAVDGRVTLPVVTVVGSAGVTSVAIDHLVTDTLGAAHGTVNP